MRLGSLLGVAALVVLPLGGCAMETSSICVEYVDFETPAAAAAGVAVVVVGTVVGSAGQREIYGEPAPVHRFAIESVLKGEVPGDAREIDVASVPQSCNGADRGPFPDGDPLDTTDRVELFLSEEDGAFHTVTPWDGVESAPPGKPLPWDPAAATD